MTQSPYRPDDDQDPSRRGQPEPPAYGQPAAGEQPAYGQPGHDLPAYAAPGQEQSAMPSAQRVPPGTGRPGKGLAIAALVLGILGILSSWVPFVGALLGIIAIVLGIVAVRRAAGKGMAITGIVLGVIALIVGAIFTVGWIFAYNLGQDCIDQTGESAGAEFEQCIEDRARDLTT